MMFLSCKLWLIWATKRQDRRRKWIYIYIYIYREREREREREGGGGIDDGSRQIVLNFEFSTNLAYYKKFFNDSYSKKS